MALVAMASSSGSRSTNGMLEETVVADVAALVEKWRPDDDGRRRRCSLFLDGGVAEAGRFMSAAVELHRGMLVLASDVEDARGRGDERLVRAQGVLEDAMRRLQLELEILLSAVRSNAADDGDGDGAAAISGHGLDGDGAVVVGHIRLVAEAMMAAGYGMECVTTFMSHRRAEFAGAVRRLLGYAPSQHARFRKLAWDDVDGKVRSWHTAAGFAFNFAFSGERVLCHRVFAAADAGVADRVFEGIASDHAADLLAVAEAAVARARRAPERLFHVLDVHATLVEILPAIVCVLGDKSEAAVRATAALRNAGEAARGILVSFEEAIQKATSKSSAAATGGAVHPLARYVMNYLVLLADYDDTLARIYQQGRGSTSPHSPSSSSSSSNPIGRLVSVLLRKLDAMAGRHRSPAARSLFMANNTHYVSKKVRGSSKLVGIVGGEGWAVAQSAETRRHVDAFVHAAWRDVLVVGGEGADAAVREAVASQRRWVAVADDEMGDAVRAAAAAAVVPAYRALYRRHGMAAWMTPGDVNAMIGRLFGGPGNAAAGARPVAAGGATPRRHRLRLTSSSQKLAHKQ
uniref:Exocyst subunit Exo70 family protein n=1 Tax=Oryza meridionalis TaxID=40149 RepID=A0A0E0F861_9ORYZ